MTEINELFPAKSTSPKSGNHTSWELKESNRYNICEGDGHARVKL